MQKQYTLVTTILRVDGHQAWTVTASSPEEAIAKYHAGESKFDHEEIEVTDLDEPEIVDD